MDIREKLLILTLAVIFGIPFIGFIFSTAFGVIYRMTQKRVERTREDERL